MKGSRMFRVFFFLCRFIRVCCVYLLVDIAKTVALQVVVGFQRAAEVLHLLHYAIHFRKTSVHKIPTVWSRCVAHKETGKEHYILNLFLSFIFFVLRHF